MNLLSNMRTNAKTRKMLDELKIEGVILYLEPSVILCPAATQGCLNACLKSAGRMAMSNAVTARQKRTELWHKNKRFFLDKLRSELTALQRRAKKKGFKAVARLNGTSDIDWSEYGLFDEFPDIQFYDYTKRPDVAIRSKAFNNYHITFSRSGRANESIALRLLKEHGINIAAVFDGTPPSTYLGQPVVDGDKSDFRFLDTPRSIVGLKAKGKARGPGGKGDGFVVRVAS